MKDIVILGAGTAGTTVANRLVRTLDTSRWRVTVVDRDEAHLYQPGLLFIPFGIYERDEVIRPRRPLLAREVTYLQAEVDRIETDEKRLLLEDGSSIPYDYLVIATGARLDPEETEGLVGAGWRETIFDFYTLDGAVALAERLRDWEGGRLVMHIAEMPIKCPVAPLEFLFLADAYFSERGIRDRVTLTLVTPLDGAFTKPIAAERLGEMLERKGIEVVPEFNIERVDPAARRILAYDGREVGYDLLVTVPVNRGDPVIERSGLGDELDFVPTDRHTLQAIGHEEIFVLGDATDLPSSKAGSVAHFQVDVFVENFERLANGLPLEPSFDGHANCFVESGYGKGLLIDFNYDVQPLPGRYPFPVLGPFALLRESRLNHWGKMAFKWMYWNLLLPGRRLPLPARMSMVGKQKELT